MADKIATYICIGDSMSIDCYPYFELSKINPEVSESVGAASLFYKNDSQVWPEFEGRDLFSKYPKIKFCNLAEDGATTFDFLDDEYFKLLKGVEAAPSIVTVTLCGNDLLRILAQPTADFTTESSNILGRYNMVIDKITSKLPRSICILSTVYDPTDGTGELAGSGNIKQHLPLLHHINNGIKDCAKRKSAMLADVHERFLGHGISAPARERWYWEPSPIEPGARGASEIRRLWYELLLEEELI